MKYFYYLIAGCLFLSSCTNDNPIIDEPINEEEKKDNDPNQDLLENPFKTIELSEAEHAIANCQIDFAFDYFKATSKRMENNNFIISPLSAYVCLSNLANGAVGETKAELISRLLEKDSSLEDLNNYNKRIIAELTTLDQTTIFELANSIWHSPSFTLESDFCNSSKEFYGTSINSVNFADSNSYEVMDNWINNVTHGLIKNFTKPNPNLQLIISNAIYFKGKWSQSFDVNKTTDADFKNHDGSVSKVRMMEGERYDFIYPDEANGKFAIAAIPYGYESFAFYVAFSIDDNDWSLNNIEDILIANNLLKFSINGSRYGKKYIKLPRFEVSADDQIKTDMEAIGLTNLFSDQATLSNLTKQPIGYKSMVQNCTFKIEETGAEGAAHTQWHIVSSDLNSKPIQEENPAFTVDRPFVFWVMDKNTNALLFMGRINNF